MTTAWQKAHARLICLLPSTTHRARQWIQESKRVGRIGKRTHEAIKALHRSASNGTHASRALRRRRLQRVGLLESAWRDVAEAVTNPAPPQAPALPYAAGSPTPPPGTAADAGPLPMDTQLLLALLDLKTERLLAEVEPLILANVNREAALASAEERASIW